MDLSKVFKDLWLLRDDYKEAKGLYYFQHLPSCKQDYYNLDASLTKLTWVFDVSFGDFILWSMYNFKKQCNSF
jgi:hypothetical protein